MSKMPKSPFRFYRNLIITASLILASYLSLAKLALADPAAPGTVIDNTATGSFQGETSGTTGTVTSNTVTLTVLEVAGITAVPSGNQEAAIGVTNAGTYQGVAGINTGDVVYFNFTITNVGNDPTQFFIPGTATITGATLESIQIIAVDPDGTGLAASKTVAVTVPNAGGNTLTLLGTTDGYIPVNGTVTVRVAVKVTETVVGNTIAVIFGNTPPNDNTSATQNQVYTANGTLDVYTIDLANSTANPYPIATFPTVSQVLEANGVPANGDVTNQRQEASARGSVVLAATPLVSGYKSVQLINDADTSSSITPNDRLTWRVSYANTGTVDVTNFQITDVLPTGVTLFGTLAAANITVNATQATAPSPNGSYNGTSNNTLFASGVTLKAGGVITVDIPVTINGGVISGTVLSNQSTANSNNLPAAGVKTDNIDNTTALPLGVTPLTNSIAQTQTVAIDPTRATTGSSLPQAPLGQCISPIANLNSSNYTLNTALQSSFPRTFFGGAMQFSASLSGTATWNLGVQVRNDPGPTIGDYIFLQPQGASNYLNTINEATYVLTFPIPLTSFSMVVGGLNNNDGTTVTALNGVTPIPITAANFSALNPPNPPGPGLSVIAPNTVVSTAGGGIEVNANTYLLTIPGPVTSVTVVSGKNENPNNNTVTIGLTTFNICYATLSGTVFGDSDGSKVQNGGELGTNAGGLNAVLVNSSNVVVATTAVAANGTYSFNNVAPGTYTVRVTTTPTGTPPAVTLPNGWVSTGENLGGGIDGTVDGIISVTVASANITGLNLGIEQRPTAVGGTAASQANPTGTNTVTVAPTLFTGSTDPDGTVAFYKITAFPSNATSITINGTNYTSGTFPVAGVTVNAAQLANMLVDPIDGAVTVGIPFQVIDNAGQLSSNTATASLPFTSTGATTPNLLLVKRLTAINGVPITGFNNDGIPASADDNANWPTPATYLQGEVTRNNVKPGDRLEYTIYFLSAGDTDITNVTICDLVPPQTIFVNDAYDVVGGGSGLGIGFANSTTALPTAPTSYLTSVLDGDRGRFYPANTTPPTTCKKPITNATLTDADNTDGLVTVDVVKRTTAIIPVPAAEKIPFATAPGVPFASYGFVRFQVTVK